MSSLNPLADVMDTEPTGASVEDGRTDPARAFVLAVVDLLQGLEDLVVGPVLLGLLDDLLLVGRVVQAGQCLLDVDGAGHGAALPTPSRGDARIRSGSGCRDTRRAARRPDPAEGRRCPRPRG